MADQGQDPFAFLQGMFGNNWDTGLAMMHAANNPTQAGQMLDQMGVPIPGQTQPGFGQTPSPLSALMQPQPQPTAQTGLQQTTQMTAPVLAQNPTQPTAVAGNPPPAAPPTAFNPANVMRVAPPQPVTPLMHGGVTGGVKPPDASTGIKAGTMPGAMQALMAAILGQGGQRQNPLTVPTLGSLISGR